MERRLSKIEWPEIDNDDYIKNIILPEYHKYY